MVKKQTLLVTAIITVAIIVVATTGWLIWNQFVTRKTPQKDSLSASEETQRITPQSPNTVSLQPNKQPSSGGLQVSNAPNASANLGSGQKQITSVAGASAANTDSFRSYEQYKDAQEVYFADIQQGNGAVAQKDSQLAVTYKGYLTNGQLFDQSRTGNNGHLQPLLFTLGGGQLIPGFEQGVAGMKAGGTRRIIIPPALAYGDSAQNGIPAKSVLVFDVQLLTVQ